MKTTKKQIVEWGMRNIDECGYGVEASDMDTRCWRCGYERTTERCHVIPKSLNGPDVPSNYRLLCHDCHLENPNVNDPTEMDKWIRRTCVPTYDTFWRYREAKYLLQEIQSNTIIHFGEKETSAATKKWVIEKWKERLPELKLMYMFDFVKNFKRVNSQ